MNASLHKNLHTLFEAGTVLKACDSVVEMALGASFYFLSTATINRVILALTGDELTERPRDFIWSVLFHNFNGLSGGFQEFLAFIFVGHGILKLVLLAGMTKKKLWIYPLAVAAFLCFITYQIIEISFSFSVLLTIMTAYDTAFMFLIVHEYRYQKRILAVRS